MNGLAGDAAAVGDRDHGSGPGRRRWVVARTFTWLHQVKRLPTGWEYRANVQDELGILVEVEAGRGAKGNAVHRDLVRSSLIVDQRFLALGVMRSYRHQSGGRPIIVSSYRDSKDQLDALYASGRLRLPFEGVLLFGY